MASYTSIALVKGEIPDPPAILTDALITQYIADNSAIVRGKLRALPDSLLLNYPSADPYIERITRFLAAYDAMCFIELQERRFEGGVPKTYLERAEAMLNEIRSGAYQVGASTSKTISMARSKSDRLVTLTNQGYSDETEV